MFAKSAFALIATVALLAACADMGGTDPSDVTLGSPPPSSPASAFGHNYSNTSIVMTGPGMLLSSWAGIDIGKTMNDASRNANKLAEKRAFTAPIGQQLTWNDPSSGNSGTVTATGDNYDNAGVYCRQFQQSVTIDAVSQTGQAKACQQPDGTWKILH